VLEHGGNVPARSPARTGITLGDTRAITSLAVSAVLFALLVVIETRTQAPCCHCACCETGTGPEPTR
jgi:hypothetical protein